MRMIRALMTLYHVRRALRHSRLYRHHLGRAQALSERTAA